MVKGLVLVVNERAARPTLTKPSETFYFVKAEERLI